ncbi:serine-rich adhesin for platelets-like [Hetaerina americana]|uniref:serine-rich adhesin for platelets-like n=1 Tax=Hetaerina americana TaxID=62018 RepID=UPI003A7F1BBB
MSAPSRRPVAPKLGNSFLTRQLSLQSPTPPNQQPLQQNNQQMTHQHRKLAFRRQSSEDLSFRRGRRKCRNSPSPAPSPASERAKCKNPPPNPPHGASGGDEKRVNSASDRSSDVRWSSKQDQPTVAASPSLFNRHFPHTKEQPPCPPAAFPVGGGGPVAGRPITPARPRPVRLAWAEKRSATVQQPSPAFSDPPQSSEDLTEDEPPVEVVAKKMGQPKPVTGSVLKAQLVRNQHSLPSMAAEKDSVLKTRQQLADKLRRAWWGEDQLRPNLDIFLTCLANESNEKECTPPGDEQTKEGIQKKHLQKDNAKESADTATEQRESKMISIKIETMAGENSSKEGDDDDVVSSELKECLASGSLSKSSNGRPRPPSQASYQSPSPSKSTSSTSLFSSKATLTSSNEPKASSNPFPCHLSGNEFVCGVGICEKVKDSFPFGEGCDDGSGGEGEYLPETAPFVTVTPSAASLQTSASPFPSGFADAIPAGGQVTNGFSTQVGKGAPETKREATTPITSRAQSTTGHGNEGKATGSASASLKRAQFRNNSMNKRTLARSADTIPPTAGPGGGSVASGSTTSSMAAVAGSSRASTCSSAASNSTAAEAANRAREDVMRWRRGVQQVPDSAAERNPWKRNAESAGITRASSVDGK